MKENTCNQVASCWKFWLIDWLRESGTSFSRLITEQSKDVSMTKYIMC